MEILAYAVLLILSASIKAQIINLNDERLQKNLEFCKKLAKDPYFEAELVLGKPWRVYHTWHVKMETMCTDIQFRKPTPAIIQRIWSDMHDYVEQQPYWESAALLMEVRGAGGPDVLLFPAQGVAGGFTGVPDIIRTADMAPMKRGVPLLKFQLKLVRHGKFLVFMDCHAGVASLAARAERRPRRAEVAAAVDEVELGDGFPACTQEKNKDEQFFV